MTTDTKKLAEFAAEFLEFKKETNYELNQDYWHKTEWIGEPLVDRWLNDYFFKELNKAPILAHLAKLEMEKRGYQLEYNKFTSQGHQWWFHKTYDMPEGDLGTKEWTGFWEKTKPIWQKNNNEFIALWSAIEATGEK